MNNPWKLILLLTGIFLAGTVTGGFATQRYIRKEFAKRFSPEQWCPSRLEMLTKRLALSPEQQAKLRPIMQRDRDELIRIRNNTVNETRRIIEQMDRDVTRLLTAEQQVKFEQINQTRRERMKRFFKGQAADKPETGETPEAVSPSNGPDTPKPEIAPAAGGK